MVGAGLSIYYQFPSVVIKLQHGGAASLRQHCNASQGCHALQMDFLCMCAYEANPTGGGFDV